MRAYIDVVDEAERDLIAQALADPAIRALVKVLGALLPLNEDQRARVLRKVAREVRG